MAFARANVKPRAGGGRGGNGRGGGGRGGARGGGRGAAGRGGAAPPAQAAATPAPGVGRRPNESAAEYLERLNAEVDREQQRLRQEELQLRRVERQVADEEDRRAARAPGDAGGTDGLMRELLDACRQLDGERRGHLAPKDVWLACGRCGLPTSATELKAMCERCDFDDEGDVNYAQLLGLVVGDLEDRQRAMEPEPPREARPDRGGGPRAVTFDDGGDDEPGYAPRDQRPHRGGAPPPPRQPQQQNQQQQNTPEQQQRAPQPHASPGAGATPGRQQFMSALSNMHGGRTPEEVFEHDRRRAELRRDLDEQVAAKRARDEARREELRRIEEREERAAAGYNPWGRGGGGAPLRDADGAVVSDLRGRGLSAENTPERHPPPPPPQQQHHHHQHNQHGDDRRPRFDEQQLRTPSAQASPGRGHFMSALSQLHGTPTQDELSAQEAQRLEYVAFLDAQVREKKAKEAARKREEEEAEIRAEADARAYLASRANERYGEVGIRGEELNLPPPVDVLPPPPAAERRARGGAPASPMSPIPGLEHLHEEGAPAAADAAAAARAPPLQIGEATGEAIGSESAVRLLQELRDEQERMRDHMAQQAILMERMQLEAAAADRQRDAMQEELEAYRRRPARRGQRGGGHAPATPSMPGGGDFSTSSYLVQKDVNSVPSPGMLRGVEWTSHGASHAAGGARHQLQAEGIHDQAPTVRRPTYDERVALGGGMMGGGGGAKRSARPPRPRQQRGGEKLARTGHAPSRTRQTAGKPVPLEERGRWR